VGNPMVACVMRSPQVACLTASVRRLLLVLLKVRESASWTKMKLWAETRCGNGRGERDGYGNGSAFQGR